MMKTRHLLMLAGASIAAWLAFFGDNSPDTELATPVARSAGMPAAPTDAMPAAESARPASSRARTAAQDAQRDTDLQILILQPRAELISADRSSPTGDGLFAGKSLAPPPAKVEVLPPPVPTAPPIPFTYLGKKTAGGQVEVFLARGDAVIVARDKSVIDGTYRVESIKPPTLFLNYLPLNQIQQISIGAID